MAVGERSVRRAREARRMLAALLLEEDMMMGWVKYY